MSILIAIVAFVGVLGILNLVLTAGVIKRLQDHTSLLSTAGGPPSLESGEEVGDFDTSTVDGEPLSREHLPHQTVVAFFSPTCGPCKEKLPKLATFAKTLPGGQEQALAVVIDDGEEAGDMVARLQGTARIVVEPADGALSTAFRVKAYPVVLRTGWEPDGRMVVTEHMVNLDGSEVTAA